MKMQTRQCGVWAANVLGLAVCATLLPGCSGHLIAKFEGDFLGQRYDIDLLLRFDEGQNEAPDGARTVGQGQVRPGAPYTIQVEILIDDDGCRWIRMPNEGKYHKLLEGEIAPGAQARFAPDLSSLSDGPLEGGAPNNVQLSDVEYTYDAEEDWATLEWTLPAEAVINLIGPMDTIFQSAWVTSLQTFADGSIRLLYEGTSNSVLGLAMMQGITELTDPDHPDGEMTFEFDPAASMVYILRDGELHEETPAEILFQELRPLNWDSD